MLKHRLITGITLTIVGGVTLFTLPAWAFAILILLFVGLGLNELFSVIENKEIGINKRLGIVLGVLVVIATYFDYKIPYNWSFLFIPAICLVIFLVQFTKRDSRAILSISTIFFGLVYVAWFLSFFIRIRMMPMGSEALRRGLVAYLILVTKSGDIAAYFIGRKFGKHKLIPRISPNKTIEGSIAGLFFSVIISLACVSFLPSFSLLHLAILGIVLGVVAQIGDLSESLIKRDCETKDSGKSLPGLGGVLDMVDSFLFAAPIFYFYIRVFMK